MNKPSAPVPEIRRAACLFPLLPRPRTRAADPSWHLCLALSALLVAHASPAAAQTESGAVEASAVEASSATAPTGAGVLTLDDALEALYAADLTLDGLKFDVRKAAEIKRQAVGVLLPSVGVSAVYTLNDEEQVFDSGSSFEGLYPYLNAVYENFGAADPSIPDPALFAGSGEPLVTSHRHDIIGTLTVEQSLYNARALPYLRQAKLGMELADVADEQVRFTLQGTLIEAYFAAVLAQQVVAVSARNVELAELVEERARGLFERGVGNQFEVNRATVETSSSRRALENAQLAHRSAIQVLAALLRREPDFDVAEPEALSAPASLVEAQAAAVEARPDLVTNEVQQEIQRSRITEARNQWFPSAFAKFQANLQRETAFSNDKFRWNIQVGVSWNVFDGGVRDALRREREAELGRLENQRTILVEEIESNLELLWLQIEQETVNVERAADEVELARLNFELTRDSQAIGVANELDVRTAQEQLMLSEVSAITSRVNLQKALYAFYRLAFLFPAEG